MFKILYICGLALVIYLFFTISEKIDNEPVSENSFNEGYDKTRILGLIGKPVMYVEPERFKLKFGDANNSSKISNSLNKTLTEEILDEKQKEDNQSSIKKKNNSKETSLKENSKKHNSDNLSSPDDDIEVSAPNIVEESFESLNNKKTNSFIDRVSDMIEQAEIVALTEIACQQDRETDEREKLNAINPFAPSEEHCNNSGSDWYDNDDYYYDNFYYPY